MNENGRPIFDLRSGATGWRSPLQAVLVVLLLLACGACESTSAPKVAESEPQPFSQDGLLEGILVDGQCLLVESADGRLYLPIFPRGSVTATSEGVLIDGERLFFGDSIALGGGEGTEEDVDTEFHGCLTGDVVVWLVDAA